MGALKYVCMSDLHFGQDVSLLTAMNYGPDPNNPARPEEWEPIYNSPSEVLKQLVECLRWLRDHVEIAEGGLTLILNGDLMELALAPMNDSAMVLAEFLKLTMEKEKELFTEIFFIPGNHDHHLWELARETAYTEKLCSLSPADPLPDVPHATGMLPGGKDGFVRPYFLKHLVKWIPTIPDFEITVAYPNLGLIDAEETKTVLLSHGHFVEFEYSLVSTFKTLIFKNAKFPQTIPGLEAENFAWIDFFWSALGRSGDFGKYVELIYEGSVNPREIAEVLVKGLIAKSSELKPWVRLGSLLEIEAGSDMAEALTRIVESALIGVASRERSNPRELIGKKADDWLDWYFTGPVCEQWEGELNGPMPHDVTIVFGHTHKPYARFEQFNHYALEARVYNTGGWVVDTTEPQEKHGGGIVLIDEDLNTILLTMYREHKLPQRYWVRVEKAGTDPNPLYDAVKPKIQPRNPPWSTFSQTVAKEVENRQAYLEVLLESAKGILP